MKEKIALFSASLGIGGAERVIATLANGFYSAGHSVDVVLVKRVGGYIDELDEGVNIVDLASSRTFFAMVPLIRYLRRTQPTAMLATQGHVNIIAVIAHCFLHSSFHLSVREATTASIHYRNASNLRTKVIQLLTRTAYFRASKVIAPSQGVADDLVKSFKILPSHIVVISNPLDFEHIRARANEPIPDQVLNAYKTPIVLGIGRLTAPKDFATLIEAFSQVAQAKEVRLIILGEGEDRKALQSLVQSLGLEKKVDMPGFVDNPFAYLKQSAVYVLSSRYEGLSNTLLQALAVGTPSVATDCPSGPNEILEGGRWGRLVPVGDVNAMSQAIIDGLEGRIAMPPTELLQARYGIDGITQKYLDVLLDR